MGFGGSGRWRWGAVPPAGHRPSGQYRTPQHDPLFSQQLAHSDPESKMPSPQGVPSGGSWPWGRAGARALSVCQEDCGDRPLTPPSSQDCPVLQAGPARGHGGAPKGGRRWAALGGVPRGGEVCPQSTAPLYFVEGLFDLGAACGRRGVSTGSWGLLERQEGTRTGRHTPSLLRAPQTRETHPGQASGRGRGRGVLEGTPVRGRARLESDSRPCLWAGGQQGLGWGCRQSP